MTRIATDGEIREAYNKVCNDKEYSFGVIGLPRMLKYEEIETKFFVVEAYEEITGKILLKKELSA